MPFEAGDREGKLEAAKKSVESRRKKRIELNKQIAQTNVYEQLAALVVSDRQLRGKCNPTIIDFVKDELKNLVDPEIIRKKLGITGGYNDKQWQNIIVHVRNRVIGNDLVVQTAHNIESMNKELDESYGRLKSMSNDDNLTSMEKIRIIDAMNRTIMNKMDIAQKVLDIGVQTGSIDVRKEQEEQSKQPMIIINQHLPRPNLNKEQSPITIVKDGKSMQQYQLEDEDNVTD